MSEVVFRCLPHRKLWAINLSRVATQWLEGRFELATLWLQGAEQFFLD